MVRRDRSLIAAIYGLMFDPECSFFLTDKSASSPMSMK
jgi:hypothetical protein